MTTLQDKLVDEILHAADNVIWKLSHNMQTRDGSIVPSTITRQDATARILRQATARLKETIDPTESLCGMGMCDMCDARWCEDGQD